MVVMVMVAAAYYGGYGDGDGCYNGGYGDGGGCL